MPYAAANAPPVTQTISIRPTSAAGPMPDNLWCSRRLACSANRVSAELALCRIQSSAHQHPCYAALRFRAAALSPILPLLPLHALLVLRALVAAVPSLFWLFLPLLSLHALHVLPALVAALPPLLWLLAPQLAGASPPRPVLPAPTLLPAAVWPRLDAAVLAAALGVVLRSTLGLMLAFVGRCIQLDVCGA